MINLMTIHNSFFVLDKIILLHFLRLLQRFNDIAKSDQKCISFKPVLCAEFVKPTKAKWSADLRMQNIELKAPWTDLVFATRENVIADRYFIAAHFELHIINSTCIEYYGYRKSFDGFVKCFTNTAFKGNDIAHTYICFFFIAVCLKKTNRGEVKCFLLIEE